MPFKNTFGFDLGSSTVKMYSRKRNKTYIERNMLSYKGHKILAVGNEAYEMFEKTPEEIVVEAPVSSGKIANTELAEIVLRKCLMKAGRIPSTVSEIYFAAPSGLSTVEKRAYYKIVNGSFLTTRKVFTIDYPIADAYGLGIDPVTTGGCMIVNIGAQTTRMSVIAGGKIVITKTLPIGGTQMNESICSEIRSRYHLYIGHRTARRLKIILGRLNTDKKEARKIVGLDSISGLPREEVISSYVVGDGIRNCVDVIGEEIRLFFERIPPQIRGQIIISGIQLTGGCSRLPYLNHYLATMAGCSFKLSELYENSTIHGIEMIMNDKELRKKWAVQIKPRTLS